MNNIKCLNCSSSFKFEGASNDSMGWHVVCPCCKSSFDINIEDYIIPKGTYVIMPDGKKGIVDGNDEETTDEYEDINYYICPEEYAKQPYWSNHYRMFTKDELKIIREKKMLIVGRTGSGKDTYAGCLQKIGLSGVKSYTTRPKRYKTEDTHIFIKEEEAENYDDLIAYTEINGYKYFATRDQLNTADYYIIDPDGIEYLLKKVPDLNYKIIYIYTDENIRKERACTRGDKTEQ